LRRFELLLLFADLFAVTWPALFGVRPRRGIASGLIFATMIAQLQIEGFRWQLIFLYLISVGLIIGDIVFLDRELRWTNRVARGIFGVVGLLIFASPGWLLPVPNLPAPSGPEVIGTEVFELVDRERDQTYGPRPGADRRIVVQAYYPALSDSEFDRAPIHPNWDVVGPALARSVGLPGWFFDHVRYTRSHTYMGLNVAPGTYPVVVYSHGWTGYRSVGLTQIETLVSNGYIVLAIDHTYGAVATVLADGEVVPYDEDALPDQESVTEAVYDEASELLVEVYASDIVTVLDALEEGEEGPLATLAGNMDLTRIGLFGHSTGGGAAVTVCLQDERCDAVLGMDPWVEPIPNRVLALSATRPAMFLRSAEWQEKPNDPILRGIAERSERTSYWIAIDGTGHNDFTVAPLLSPVADEFGLKGPIGAGRIISIVNQYLLGFFDVFLLGTGPASIEAVSFDEVSLEILGTTEPVGEESGEDGGGDG
jgi:predicted dienelactone hydrolase